MTTVVGLLHTEVSLAEEGGDNESTAVEVVEAEHEGKEDDTLDDSVDKSFGDAVGEGVVEGRVGKGAADEEDQR